MRPSTQQPRSTQPVGKGVVEVDELAPETLVEDVAVVPVMDIDELVMLDVPSLYSSSRFPAPQYSN